MNRNILKEKKRNKSEKIQGRSRLMSEVFSFKASAIDFTPSSFISFPNSIRLLNKSFEREKKEEELKKKEK